MCLAIPGRILKIEDDEAVIDYGGVTRRASLRLCPAAKINDAALVHAGFVIQLLNEEEAQELMDILAETEAP
ncbi:MAG TPA: HypC/HybG/HupF family hydrogenase formation chaperone [Clostridia bacterium]|nr:HypC/HybG/HupF family hydrogenase formation chaperone [Clostridia bacterium]